MKLIILFIVFLYQTLSRKLILVQNLFRHGARYPIFTNDYDFTNQPHILNNAGQLTTQGKNMHYMLGKALNKKYWNPLFGNTSAQNKIDPRLIYAKSTNVNRTIESLQSQLRGWLENLPSLHLNKSNLEYSLPAFQNIADYVNMSYTENGQDGWDVFNELPQYHPIPIHTGLGGQGVSSSNPYDQGQFLLKFDKLNCPKQDDWTQQNFKSQMGVYVQNLPQVKQAMQKLKQTFPNMNLTFQTAYRVIDNAVCMKYLGEPTLKVFQDPKYQKVFKYIKQITVYLSLFYQPIQYQTASTALLKNTIYNIQNAIKQTGPKLVLYSAHDTTVALAIAAFNLSNVNCINDKYLKDMANQETCVSDYPPFTANFIIQLYKENNGTYTFDIVVDNIQRRIPFCDWKLSCPVQKLYSWVDSWKVQNPNQVCGIQDVYKTQLKGQKKYRMKLYVVIAILALIVLILSIFTWHLYTKLRNSQAKTQGYIQNFQEKDHAHQAHQLEPITT